MARRTATQTAPTRTIVRHTSAPPVKVTLARELGRRAGRATRRAGGAIARGASEEKHRLAAIVAAGALGWAKKSGWSLPSIGPLGTSGSAALIAYGIARMTGSRVASHAATGLACVAAYSLGREGSVAGVMVHDGDD